MITSETIDCKASIIDKRNHLIYDHVISPLVFEQKIKKLNKENEERKEKKKTARLHLVSSIY